MPRSENYSYSPYGDIPAGIENVTPDDDIEYTGVQGFICDDSGTLAVQMDDGSTGTYYVTASVVYPGRVKKVKSTGTSGPANIALLY